MPFPRSSDDAPADNEKTPFPDDFSAMGSLVAKHGGELTQLPNVVRVGVGFKVVGGRETHRRCVTVFVTAKLPESELAAGDVIPSRFHLHLTDVVELPPLDS
jgi:hypothetical protein